jgi:hypothetical protein
MSDKFQYRPLPDPAKVIWEAKRNDEKRNDEHNYQQWRYQETINNYNWIIAELHKMQDIADPLMGVRIEMELKKAKKELAKIQTDYNIFKRYGSK